MAKEPILIFADIEIKELIPGFLDNRKKELQELNAAVSSVDFATLQTIGHRLKGSSGGYGFAGLGEFGASLEKAARAQDIKAATQLVLSIVDYLERVVVTYEKAS